MTMSDWAILIGSPLIFGTVAIGFIINGKPGIDVLTAGVVFTLPCWLVNQALPPIGAGLLGGLIAFAAVGAGISVWREKRDPTDRCS